MLQQTQYPCYITFIDPVQIFNLNTTGRIEVGPSTSPTATITAGGYIINDIYDESVDKINKDKIRIINKKLSARIAIFWYFAFTATEVWTASRAGAGRASIEGP